MALERAKRLISTWALIFTTCAFICITVAFATPHWLERFPHKRMTRCFVRMGLWEFCFNDWTYYKDYLGKKYNGCWWIYHFEYRPVWNWLNPIWLLMVQIMMALAFTLHLFMIVLNVLYYVRWCPKEKENKYLKVTNIMMWIAATLISISVTIFGIKADVDRQWLPNPDSNFLSWSFGCAVLSGFFSIFSAMCMSVDYLRIREEEERLKRGAAYPVRANPKF